MLVVGVDAALSARCRVIHAVPADASACLALPREPAIANRFDSVGQNGRRNASFVRFEVDGDGKVSENVEMR